MTTTNEQSSREPRKRWTKAEDEVLRQSYLKERAQDIADRLGRPLHGVLLRAQKIGLQKNVPVALDLTNVATQAEEARRLFSYDHATGQMFWNIQRAGRVAGESAGTLHHNGYYVVRFLKKFHRLHRVIWLHQYGEWPKNVIDHINGDGLDNRLCNLRDVTVAQNQWNRARPNCGTRWNPSTNRWDVQLRVSGRLMRFGSYPDEQTARAVGTAAIKEHLGEYARF